MDSNIVEVYLSSMPRGALKASLADMAIFLFDDGMSNDELT